MPNSPPTDVISAHLRAIMQSVDQELSKVFTDIATAFKDLPEEIRPVFRSLANLGWFPSGKMGLSEIHVFRDLCDSGDKSAVNAKMIEWIEGEQHQILERASTRFPTRGRILVSAFAAHSAGKYELSIPVLMAQVEGMCLEVVGTKLFSTKNGVPATKAATETFCQMAFTDALLLPFRELNGFTASESERHRWPDVPNRHEVLHGISTSYGTRENSFKTISLMEYFITFVEPKFPRKLPH